MNQPTQSTEQHTADYDAARITPEGRARLDKYGSTLDAGNVRVLCERIADYPEVLAAAAAVLAEELNRDAVTFKSGWGSNDIDNARLWGIGACIEWLRSTRVTSPVEGRA